MLLFELLPPIWRLKAGLCLQHSMKFGSRLSTAILRQAQRKNIGHFFYLKYDTEHKMALPMPLLAPQRYVIIAQDGVRSVSHLV